MRLSFFLLLALTVFIGVAPGAAQAVMVDFEPGTYTAGAPVAGTDGWVPLLSPNVVTATPGEVLVGTQSAKLGGSDLSAIARLFDAGPTEFGTGSILSSHVMLGGGAGSVEMFYSQVPLTFGATPGGIIGYVGGNFTLFGSLGSPGTPNELNTGYEAQSGVDYLLEMEFDLYNNEFDAYVTPAGGARTLLGTQSFVGLNVTPNLYPTSGVILLTRDAAVGVFDDVDMLVVDPNPPAPLLPEPIDFEDDVYVAGSTAIGVDGWKALIQYAPNTSGMITDVDVIDGAKSLQVSGESILARNFGEGTSYDDGSIISAKMMITDGSEGASGEFYFSHDLVGGNTPIGIQGIVGGNFLIWGKEEGTPPYTIDSGVEFLTDNEYLLELQLDLTDQTFKSYVTDLTGGGARTLLGEAGYWLGAGETVVPGDDSNAGYVLFTHGDAVVSFDDFNCQVPEPSTLTALLGLMLGAMVSIRRRKAA